MGIETQGSRASALRLVLAACFSALCALSACAPAPGAPLGYEVQAIVGGEPSGPEQDAVVLLRNPRGECTATLVAPNLIATARHCLSSSNLAMSCTPRGETRKGGEVGADYEPARVAIYLGGKLDPASLPSPTAVGSRVVHDASVTLCNHDLAFLVLGESVKGVVPARVRLDGPVLPGESFTAVGWGVSDAAGGRARRARRGVKVTAVGSSAQASTGPAEFGAGEAVCDGDSGGPALAESDGALLGVVTRGGSPRVVDLMPPEACQGADIVNVYTSLEANAELVQEAFRQAGQPVPPGPRPGDPCAAARCPAGTACVLPGATCKAVEIQPGQGCSSSPLAPGPAVPFHTLVLLGLALARRCRPRFLRALFYVGATSMRSTAPARSQSTHLRRLRGPVCPPSQSFLSVKPAPTDHPPGMGIIASSTVTRCLAPRQLHPKVKETPICRLRLGRSNATPTVGEYLLSELGPMTEK